MTTNDKTQEDTAARIEARKNPGSITVDFFMPGEKETAAVTVYKLFSTAKGTAAPSYVVADSEIVSDPRFTTPIMAVLLGKLIMVAGKLAQYLDYTIHNAHAAEQVSAADLALYEATAGNALTGQA